MRTRETMDKKYLVLLTIQAISTIFSIISTGVLALKAIEKEPFYMHVGNDMYIRKTDKQTVVAVDQPQNLGTALLDQVKALSGP